MDRLGYPLPSADWVRRKTVASDLELLAAHKRGYLLSDAAVAGLWATIGREGLQALSEIDQRRSQSLLDKYFALLLILLFEEWFLLEKPRLALELLVTTFKESELIWIDDQRLPSGVAGIAETYDTRPAFDPEEFRLNVRIHSMLSNYVRALVAHDLLRGSVL